MNTTSAARSREQERDQQILRQIHRTLQEARLGERSAVAVVLAHRRGLRTVRRLVEVALERGNNCMERVISMCPPHALRPLACKAGCSTCCILKVGISAPEAIVIAAHLRSRLLAEDFLALRQRVEQLDDRIHGLNENGRIEVQERCALLADDLCSIYSVRPFACRWTTSPSLAACIEVFVHNREADVTADNARTQPLLDVWQGMLDGITDAGLDGRTLEMTSALRVALGDESIADRWLAGERAFDYASVP